MGEAWTPAGPDHGPRHEAIAADRHAATSSMAVTGAPTQTCTPRPSSWRTALRGQFLRISGQDAGARLHENHPRRPRVDAAELAGQGVARDLGQRSRHLDSGRSPADHHEGEPLPAPLGVRLALGLLEREQYPSPQLEGIVQGLQAGRDGAPTRRGRSRSGWHPWP